MKTPEFNNQKVLPITFVFTVHLLFSIVHNRKCKTSSSLVTVTLPEESYCDKTAKSYNIGMFYAPGAWSLCDSVFCYGFPNDKLFLRLQKRIRMIQNQSVLLQNL